MLLRFRLDKTAKAGTRVIKRYCNIACTWCHHDFFLHDGFIAIGNDEFREAIQKVIHATSAKEVHVRLAGDGDPTIVGEDELADLIAKLKSVPQVTRVKITTNGILLGVMSQGLYNAGIDTITVSLNSLSKIGYQKYAKYDYLETVLNSIDIAYRVGITLKINVIYWKWNETEIEAFEAISCKYSGMPIKVFDLLVHTEEDRELFLPLERLEERLLPKAVSIKEEQWPYPRRIYKLRSGAIFDIKIAGLINNCPNLSCHARSICLEGCRHSIRIGLDGVMQPCGVRTDNKLNLLDPSTTDDLIRFALHSGGKVGYDFVTLSDIP